MKSQKLFVNVVLAATSTMLAAGIAQWSTNGVPEDCGCGPVGKPGQGRLSELPKPGPMNWCITQELADLNREVSSGVTTFASCSISGPPDTPAVRNAAIPDANTPIKTFRLTFHVFCENGGANPAATASDVQAAVNRLNANFAPWRIQFVYEYRFVNSTKYRYLDRNSEEQGMKNSYNLSPATKLNVYVVDTGGVCWGVFPWMSNALTSTGGVVMHYYWFNAASPLPNVFSHEVGHNLGLYHVFHGYDEVTQCGPCYEPAGRSAEVGDTTGDFCSDTNATTRNQNNCADPTDTDPCNGLPYTDTPYGNYMSYSNQCQFEFTSQQAGRMHAWSNEKLRGWMELPPPPAVPGTPTLSKSGTVITIVWADNSNNETGFEVQRERRTGGNKWGESTIVANVGADVTSTTNSPGTGTFRYRVRSYNGNGPSNWSAWASITN